jgi:thiol-disulfide isomerase/thioredoxin
MKRIAISILFCVLFINAKTQNAYEIKFKVDGLKDSVCYLFRYHWESHVIVDTAKVRKGNFVFSGKESLEKGIYFLVRQNKTMLGLDFLVDSAQKFSIAIDTVNLYRKMKIAGSPLNENFKDFVLFMTDQNKAIIDYEKELKLRQDKDSTLLLTKERVKRYQEIKKYQNDYLANNPRSYLSTIIRLQSDVQMPEIPKASNGRRDSVWEYNYYLSHYWGGIPLNNVGTINTNKLYYNKLKNYFEKLVLQDPDSLIKTCDWLMKQTEGCEEMHKYMGFYLTYTIDRSKTIGHDAVFVDLVNKYYKTNKADWYDEKQNQKIIERGEILEPLLIGKTAPDLDLIDTAGAAIISKLGMDTITTSENLTKAYYNNLATLQKLYTPLNKVNADYTIVIFWDVDCGHCQKEVPQLMEAYNKMKADGKKVEVYAVYVHQDVKKWKKFIREKKLNWINVYDGAHLNDFKKKYDIYSYPVIYLLDKNKTIKSKRIGVESVEPIIEHLQKNG